MSKQTTHRGLRRPLALLLALIMCLSLLPGLSMTAYAAGETLTFGVEGWTEGNPWVLTRLEGTKALSIKLDGLDNSKGYQVRISLKMPFYFNNFYFANGIPSTRELSKVWYGTNAFWGTGQATPSSMEPYVKSYHASYDDNNTPNNAADDWHVMTISLNSGSTYNYSMDGMYTVRPHQGMAYNGDEITDAIKVELLNEDGTQVLQAKKVNKVVIDEHLASDQAWSQYTIPWGLFPGTVIPGAVNSKLFRNETTSGAGHIALGLGYSELKVVQALPEIVTNVTQVKVRYQSLPNNSTDEGAEVLDASKWSFDAANHKVTINLPDPAVRGSDWYCNYDIYGDVSPQAVVGQRYLPVGATTYSGKFYDGTAFTNAMLPAEGRLVADNENASILIQRGYQTMSVSGSSASSQPAKADAQMGIGSIIFNSNGAKTEEQVVKYTFPSDLRITGVPFLLEDRTAEGKLKNVKATLNNGVEYTFPEVPAAKRGDYYAAYISLGALKDLNPTIPDTATYITAIEANCGTFSKQTDTRGSSVGEHILVGRFADEVVRANVAKTITIPVEINGATFQVATAFNPAAAFQQSISSSISAAVPAGSTQNVVNHYSPRFTLINSTVDEPMFHLVLPQGITFDASTLKVEQRVANYSKPVKIGGQTYGNAANGDLYTEIPYASGRVKVKSNVVRDENNVSYTHYSIYATDTRASDFDSLGRSAHQSVRLSYQLKFADDMQPANSFDFGRLFFFGNSDKHPAYTGYNINRQPDYADLNGNGKYNDNTAFTSQNIPGSILKNENILLSVNLSKDQAGTDIYAAYDPGVDGSSDRNAVTLRPGDTVYYNATVKNTIQSPAAVTKARIYLPIAQGTLNDSTGAFTPQNTDGTFKHYQFNAYKWPMKLTAAVANPANDIFDVLYYTGPITLDANGEPTGGSATAPSDLSAVSMVGIKVKDGKQIPNGANNQYKFQLQLTINVTDAHVNNNPSLNNTKNIFRGYMFRDAGVGDSYKDSDWVAAKIAIGTIAGIAFEDVDRDGVYTPGTDSPKVGVPVKLIVRDARNQIIAAEEQTATTGTQGEYRFTNLENSSNSRKYQIEFTNPGSPTDLTDINARRFTQNVQYDSGAGYKTDSDAVPNSGHTAATVNVTLPSTDAQGTEHNLHIDAGFVRPITLTFFNDNPDVGTLKLGADEIPKIGGKSVTMWPNTAVTEPTKTPKQGYTFKNWITASGPQYANLNNVRFSKDEYLYGTWEASNATLTVNLNGGAGCPETFTVKVGEEVISFLADAKYLEPVRVNYKFAGWFVNSQLRTALTTAQKMPVGGYTVYAKWIPDDDTVAFNANGGAWGTETVKTVDGVVNAKITPPTPAPTRAGYALKGWSTSLADANAGRVVTFNNSTVFTGKSVVYYASWTANANNEVKFASNNANWGTVSPANKTGITSGTAIGTVNGLQAKPTDGYKFTGYWLCDEDKAYYTTAQITGYVISGAKTPVTFTAQFVQNDKTPVIYDFNGGVVGTAFNKMWTGIAGTAFTKPSDWPTPVKTGYTLTEPNLSNVKYPAEGAEATVIKATWTPITYNIKVELAGGTGGYAGKDGVQYTEEVTLTAPSRNGYIFTGWKASGDGVTVTDYAGGAKVSGLSTKAGATVTLTALWSAQKYSVTFDGNGGLLDGKNVVVITDAVGAAVTAPSSKTKTGYTFEAWDPATVPTQISAKDETIKATWTPIKYNIAFNGNKPTEATDNVTGTTAAVTGVEYDKEATLTTNGFKLKGWNFLGWHTNKDAKTPLYGDQAKVKNLTATDGATVTLYAIWSESDYSITYDYAGGTVGNANPPLAKTNAEITLTLPTRDGYTFDGWTAAPGVTFTDNNTKFKMPGENVTLTAKWKAIQYKVNFNINGENPGTGSQDMTAQTVTFGTPDDNLKANTFKVKGKTFVGWATSQGSKQVVYADGAAIEPDLIAKPDANGNSETTLYAVFTADSYAIVYNLGGGEMDSNNPYLHKTDDAVSIKNPTRQYWTFGGWSTKPTTLSGYDCDTSKADGKTTFTMPGENVFLTAQWNPENLQVTFVPGPNGEITSGAAEIKVPTGEAITLAKIPTVSGNEGWTFNDQWTSSLDGAVYSTADLANYVVNEPVTFTAVVVSNAQLATDKTLTFDANGGKSAPDPMIVHLGDTVNLTNLKAEPQDDQLFIGWSKSAGDKSNLITEITIEANTTIYAQYKDKPTGGKYTVTFNAGANGTISGSASVEVVAGEPLTAAQIPTVTPSDNYSFDGWTMAGSAAVIPAAALTLIPVTDNIIYTASYTKIGSGPVYHTLSFDANGGTNAPAAMSAAKGTTISLLGLVATPPNGQVFTGWTQDGRDVTEVTLNSDVTVKARYVDLASVTHTVKFVDAEGGELSSESVLQGEKIKRVPTAPTLDNKTFLGWTLDGDTTVYTETAVKAYAVTADLTFTATYNDDGVTPPSSFKTLTFDAVSNGGSGAPEAIRMPAGTTVSLNGYTASHASKIFAGWFTQAQGGDLLTQVTLAEDTTVYAQFADPELITVQFLGEDGSELASYQVQKGECVSEVPEAPELVNKDFVGWQDSSGTVYTAAGIKLRPVSAEITYIALYKDNTPPVTTVYTLTFDLNGGSKGANTPDTLTVPAGTTLSLLGLDPNPPADSTFEGWAYNGRLTDEVVMNMDKTVVAQYKAIVKHNVTFDVGENGTSNDILSYSVVDGEQLGAAPAVTAKAGFSFLGWTLGTDATVYTDTAVKAMIVTADLSFTAKYNDNTVNPPEDFYTLTLNGNGGQPASQAIRMPKDTVISLTGYTASHASKDFAGWFTAADGGSKVTEYTFSSREGTVYAQFTDPAPVVSYTVKFFDEDNTEIANSAQTVKEGACVKTVPNAPNVDGKSFVGWKDKQGTVYQAAGIKARPVTADTEYTAFYQEDVLPVTTTKTLSFDVGLGTDGPEPITRPTGTVVSLTGLTAKAPAGFNFDGWTRNGKDIVIEVKLDTDVTLKAVYTPQNPAGPFIVRFSAGENGSLEVPSGLTEKEGRAYATVYGGDKVPEVPGVTANEGYVFNDRWTCDLGGEFTTAEVLNYKVTENVEFTAIVVEKSLAYFTLTFDANGGVSAPQPLSRSMGARESLSEYKAVPQDGMLFEGWYDQSEGGNKVTEYTFDADGIVYAHYKQVPPGGKYVVTFDPGEHGKLADGSSFKEVEVAAGDSVAESDIPAVTADSDYTFTGWVAAGEEAVFPAAAIAKIGVTDHITYTASYTRTGGDDGDTVYTLVFDANGGSGAPSSLTMTKGTKLSLIGYSATAPAGKSFDGWYSQASGGRKVTEYTFNADGTVYAQYKDIVKYTVSFNEADGSLIASEEVVSGESVSDVPKAADLSAENKSFLGWTIGSDNTVYTDDAILGMAITRDTAFTACYNDDTVNPPAEWATLTLDAKTNGGFIKGKDIEEISMPDKIKLSLAGYTAEHASRDFAGWFEAAEGGRALTSYTFGKEDATLYAQYVEAKTYTVKFFELDGTTVIDEQIVKEGEFAQVKKAAAEVDNKVFAGWQDKSKTVYTDEGIAARPVTADVEYTAYYVPKDPVVGGTKTLKFDKGIGVDAPAALTLPTGTKVNLDGMVATPPANYNFTGWKLDGKLVTVVTLDRDLTVIADYSPQNPGGPFSVTFSAGAHGTLSGTAAYTVNGGDTVPDVPTITADSGYTFVGWTINGGSNRYRVPDLKAMPITGNTNFVADYERTTTGGGGGGGGAPVTPAPAADTCKQDSSCLLSAYRDLDPKAWYHDGVHFVLDKGLMEGVGNGYFQPNGTVTRAQLVTILWRLENSPRTGSQSFSDVAAGSWYEQAVAWASANRIVEGYGNGRFGPNDAITREQFATVMYRYASYKGYDMSKSADLSGYTDAGQISGWALPAMRWANAEGLITGITATTLVPGGDASRAQAATIIHRFCENVAK